MPAINAKPEEYTVLQLNQAFLGSAPRSSVYVNQTTSAKAQGLSAWAISFGKQFAPTDGNWNGLSLAILQNLNLTPPTIAQDKYNDLAAALPVLLKAYPNETGQVVLNLTNILKGLESDPNWSAAAIKFNQQQASALTHSSTNGTAELPLLETHVFTLTESIVPGEEATPDVTAIYWGYTPKDHHPTDGNGIPVKDLLSFLGAITGLDLKELGLIDDDGVGPFDNVTSLTIDFGKTEVEGDVHVHNGGVLSIGFADGTLKSAEVELGAQYFNFLNNLLFDADGNSRLYEKVIEEGSSGTEDSLQPIRLTTRENNGGTLEQGLTTAGDDTIVAGRLELLHQAYIDAGAGYNVLEIDAKGTYAQPTALLNIQEVRINDLPNFYTTEYGWGGGNLENTNFTDGSNPLGGPQSFPTPGGEDYWGSNNDSWIDLNRATAIKKLVITDQAWDSGNLTVVGVRNAATLRLEGGFQGSSTTVQYGQGQTGTLNVELVIGDMQSSVNLLQNAAVLNIDSQGVENHMHSFFAGGSVSRMIIKGSGAFGVDQDLSNSFNSGRPALIDGSANTGGIDVTLNSHYKVTVKGSASGDDEIISNGTVNVSVGNNFPNPTTPPNLQQDTARGEVSIDAGNGNNSVVADNREIANITTGTGNDTIRAQFGKEVTIVAGDGRNSIDTSNAVSNSVVSITTGVGNDTITSSGGGSSARLTIVAGDGTNTITANNNGTVSVTTGTGNDTITVWNDNVGTASVTITAGDGNNTVRASGASLTITTGAGNDTISIIGTNGTFDQGDQGETTQDGGGNTTNPAGQNDTDNYPITPHFTDTIAKGALLNISVGAGTNTINLGADRDTSTPPDGVTDTQFGVTALEGSVIAGTGIRLFVENHSDLTQADLSGATFSGVVLKQELRITGEQFSAIGSDKFSVQRDEEGATEDLYIVVTQNTTLANLVDLSKLNTAVRLHFELHNGATLTLTAEQLHKYVAWRGIDSTDGLNGKVVITDAGQNFDAFDSGNAYQVVDGGSLTDSFNASEDVTIIRKLDGGFERPKPADSTDTLTLDSNVDDTIETAIRSEVQALKIVGDKDIKFSSKVDLGSDVAGPTLADGKTGDIVANETDDFTVDFSALNGNVVGLTLANFQDVKSVKGNGSATRDVRINVELSNEASVGKAGVNSGLNSTGVQTYVVTAIGDDSIGEDGAASSATFYVCDLTKGVSTLGLKGNWNDTITFKQVNWGTNFLLEAGGTAKADGNPTYANVGRLNAEYFWQGAEAHASATVKIVNLDSGTQRTVNAAGIDIDWADSIAVNVDGSTNTIIQSVSGNSLNKLAFTAAGNVTLQGDLAAANVDVVGATKRLTSLDASGVAGTFTLQLTNTATTDLSRATVTGLDKVLFSDNATLTLSVDQALAVGAANVTSASGVTGSKMNFENLAGQAIDMTAFGAKDIGTVSIADNAGLVTLNAATVLGNALNAADSLVIKAELDDTTVEMTTAQFDQLTGTGTVTALTKQSVSTGAFFVPTMVLTNVQASDRVDLTNVDQAGNDAVKVVVRVSGVTAAKDNALTTPLNEQMKFSGSTTATLEVAAGANNLTNADLGSTFNKVVIAAGASLTLTAAQVAAIGIPDVNADKIADNWSGLAGATLNVTDLSTESINLDAIAAAGVKIGTVSIKNTDTAITLAAGTTFGGADTIVTPTKKSTDATEATSVTMTAAQYLSSDGVITGDAKIHLTSLKNNADSNADFVLDEAVIDVTGIAAPKGTITLGDPTVTLAAASSIKGFEILLSNGQMIEFSTPTQATGAKITEISGTTAVAWLFDSLGAINFIDTSKYDKNINTLFILEDLVDGQNEESLWNTLAPTIHVEKTNAAGIPDVLIAVDRVNTFEALTAIASITYDDTDQFQSVEDLTINLEGNTNIGNVTIADSVGEVAFKSLTINSYIDRTSLGADDNGFTFQPNKVGNITIGNTANENIVVTLNSFKDVDNVIGTGDDASGFLDVVNVKGPAAERDGLALQTGTIKFAAEAGKTVTLDINGTNKITIGGVDISDADIAVLDIDATGFVGTNKDLVIGGIAPTGGSTADNELGKFDHIYVTDGFTAKEEPFGVAGENLMVVTGGTSDFSKATTFDIDKIHFTGNATITLTAAQVAAIGTADGADTGTGADDWSMLAGLNVTLNIVEMDGTALDLDKVAAQGINIGTITIKDTNGVVTLNAATTLGAADKIIVPADTTLSLTAKQFDQLEGTGTIESGAVGANDTNKGVVNITDLRNTIDSNDTDTVADDYTIIDVTGVTATHGTISLATVNSVGKNDANDVSLGNIAANAHSVLGKFTIVLDDINSNAAVDNELAGQTVRFSTAAQAERTITVTGADNDAGGAWVAPVTQSLGEYYERDTNVVWLFNTISGTATAGKIDTSGYAPALGRVWVNDALVDGKNIEDIFSSPSAIQVNPNVGVINLNSTTIVRIINTATLDNLPPDNIGVDRTVEIESFTALPNGLVFNNADKLVGVKELTLDLGGAVKMGNLAIDDIVAALIANDNEFGTLTIKSHQANAADHYLLPENWVAGVNPLPSAVNEIGNISSGPTRGELARVTIDTTVTSTVLGKDNAVGLKTGTITFTDDGGLTPTDLTDDDPTAVLAVTGSKDVNIQSVNTNDTDITALTVDLTGYSGTLTAPGASPAFQMDNTETLTFVNDGGAPEHPDRDTDGAGPDTDTDGSDGVVNLGTTGATPNAGVAGDQLSFIDATGYDGDLNLGIIAQIDSTNDDRNGDGDTTDVGDEAFSMKTGQGITTATLATANGKTPTLNTGNEWVFDYTGATLPGSYLKITSSAVFQGGSTLRLTNVPLQIEGNVSLTQLVDNPATPGVEGLIMTGGSIEVLAGATLTLTPVQADALNTAGVDIVGPGTLKLVGDASNLSLGGNIKTVNVDLTGVTLIASPAAGFDADDTVDLTNLSGATVAGVAGKAQNITGSPSNDAITTTGAGDDTITGAAGNDTLNGGAGKDTFIVNAGTDTINGLATGDILNVTAGATANANTTGFVATAASVNNGTVTITDTDNAGNTTIDVSAATGATGFTLIGGNDGANGADALIGGARDDVLNGGNNDQTAAAAADTLTGNGGKDTFQFNVGTSVPLTVTNATLTPNSDKEVFQVTGGAGGNGNLQFGYSVNGIAAASPLTVAVLAGDTDQTVATKISAAFTALAGITATRLLNVVSVNADTETPNTFNNLEITSFTDPDGTGVTLGPLVEDDISQIQRVTIGANAADPVVAGEVYSVTLALVDGSVTSTFNYTAVGGDTAGSVAGALAALIFGAASPEYTAGAVGNVIDITDLLPDNGGLVVTTASAGGFSGSGASVSGAGDPATADTITDFLTGNDKIDLGLAAGTAANYVEAPEVADYATALTNADAALNGVVRYYLTSVLDIDGVAPGNQTMGVLFFDANLDGTVDGVIKMVGINDGNFGFADIIP